ncbi:MAG: hypothetical protein ACPG1C_12075 [Alphaproteobacteria bacterium]
MAKMFPTRPFLQAASAAVVIALAACAGDEAAMPLAKPAIAGTGYQVQAAQLEVLDGYDAPGHAPNIDHQLSLIPEDALVSWAKRRFKPVGHSGVMRVIILDASVTRRDLLGPDAGSSWFRDRAAEEYNGRAEVRLEFLHGNGRTKDWATAIATARRTVNESAEPAERRAEQDALVRELLRKLDREALAASRKFMQSAL